MSKTLMCLLLCMVIAGFSLQCFAGSSTEHEKELELIFLGHELSKSSKTPDGNNNSKQEVLFRYIEDAIYLCVDQSGTDGQDRLDELNNYFGVQGLPKTIAEITVPKSNEHEKYTHMGWDFTGYTMKEEWEKRQNILLATISKVFGFTVDESKSGNERYTDQCVEMAKLIYYIHILGDHARNSEKTTTTRIQLKNTKIKTSGEIEAGLINELRSCISTLFRSQRTSWKYNWLMVKLNVVRFRAWRNGEEGIQEDEDENTVIVRNEKHEKIKDIAKATLSYLSPQIKILLMEMEPPFYSSVFSGIVN